jgi:hypothetical protein
MAAAVAGLLGGTTIKDAGAAGRKFYVADPYTFLFASLVILIFGAGLFSLDKMFAKWIANGFIASDVAIAD